MKVNSMIQFLIEAMQEHNRELSNDFAHNFFKWEILNRDSVSVTIKKKTYTVTYIERDFCYTIEQGRSEVGAIEDTEGVILFLLA